MRTVLAIVIAATLVACSSSDDKGCDWKGHHHSIGEVFPDDCNTCMCSAQGVSCTQKTCGTEPDANLVSCAPSQCPNGPACGTACCGTGERCVDGTCMCGDHAACSGGDHCGGPG